VNDGARVSDLRANGRSAIPRVRWYRAYRQVGNPGVLVDSLAHYFRMARVTDTVCGVRVERRARGEFYFFLAFDTEYFGELSPEVESALEDCPLLQSGFQDPLTLDDISRMASGEMQLKALGQCINYRKLLVEAVEDPFLDRDLDREAGSDKGEQLLWYLSALGSGSWSSFRSAAASLGFGEAGDAARLARGLRLLGHLETSADGERWSITPRRVLETEQPGGDVLCFRTGARSPAAEGIRTEQRWGPDRLEGQDGSPVLSAPCPRIAKALPDIPSFRESLSPVGGVSTHLPLKRFDGSEFVPIVFDDQPGMYEVPSHQGRQMTLYFDGDAWRRGDWYGIRYLSLFDAGLLMPARYDASTWKLAILADLRPPELFERPLVLSSGLLPRREGSWFIYQNIAPEVAETVCGRLCMPLETADA